MCSSPDSTSPRTPSHDSAAATKRPTVHLPTCVSPYLFARSLAPDRSTSTSTGALTRAETSRQIATTYKTHRRLARRPLGQISRRGHARNGLMQETRFVVAFRSVATEAAAMTCWQGEEPQPSDCCPRWTRSGLSTCPKKRDHLSCRSRAPLSDRTVPTLGTYRVRRSDGLSGATSPATPFTILQRPRVVPVRAAWERAEGVSWSRRSARSIRS